MVNMVNIKKPDASTTDIYNLFKTVKKQSKLATQPQVIIFLPGTRILNNEQEKTPIDPNDKKPSVIIVFIMSGIAPKVLKVLTLIIL